jgi:hypothetical protein
MTTIQKSLKKQAFRNDVDFSVTSVTPIDYQSFRVTPPYFSCHAFISLHEKIR